MWLVGLGLMVFAGFLLWQDFQQRDKLLALRTTQTSTVAHIETLSKSMAEGLGSGTLTFMTEVHGVARTEEPLIAELSEKPCVYYDMQVQREFEETYYARDSQGRTRRRTRRSSETVSANRRSISFDLEDATGTIEIDPAGAEVIAEKVLSRFEPAQGRGSGGRLKVGRFELELPNFGGSGRRTLGYSYEERIIPVDRQVFVLGEAVDATGELRMQRPGNPENRFIVSTQSEAQLIHDLEKSLKALRFGSIACGIIGLGLFLAGLGAL